MKHKDDAEYGRTLMHALRPEERAEPPADLAARAAAAAFAAGQRRVSSESFLDVLIPLGWRAAAVAALGAAAMTVIGLRAPSISETTPTTSSTDNPMQVWWSGTTQVFNSTSYLAPASSDPGTGGSP
ncbi:MAG: hypothetical protein AB2A00_43495 [Myxococcota bacterium]